MTSRDKIRRGLLRYIGYLFPLIQSLPPLGVWTGLMTLPFAGYLVGFFTNLPTSLSDAVSEFFYPFLIAEKVLVVAGISFLIYSVIYRRTKRKEGLVTSGPYRLVRHPQYFGIILATLGMTSWSVWILNNTFGIGFLSAEQTIGVWFVLLAAYILLASVEESYISKEYGKSYENYRNRVPFLVPLAKLDKRYLEISVAVAVYAAILFGLMNLG